LIITTAFIKPDFPFPGTGNPPPLPAGLSGGYPQPDTLQAAGIFFRDPLQQLLNDFFEVPGRQDIAVFFNNFRFPGVPFPVRVSVRFYRIILPA
jgi:hypothetical protein